jgi:hypothetical protein
MPGGTLTEHLRRQDGPLELALHQCHRPSKGVRDICLCFHHRVLSVIE